MDFRRRSAPLTSEEIDFSEGLVLKEPRITDYFSARQPSEDGKQRKWIPVIEAFSFKVEKSPADIAVVDVRIEIESCTGTKEIFKFTNS